jgi:hypothetical protein
VRWTPSQIAWMAALYEGEGYVAVPKPKNAETRCKGSPLRLRFKMCDRDVLERFQRYAGFGSLHGPFKPSGLGKKVTYEYIAQGAQAYALIVAFWPWLGVRRQGQVTTAILAWAGMKQTKDGRVITPNQAIEIKRRLVGGSHGIGRQLAREFGITPGMISHIKLGDAWK